MADDEKTSSKRIHPTTAAAVIETPPLPEQEGNRGACASVAATVTTAAAASTGDIAVRKPRAAASSSYLRPSSPSCGNDSRKSSNGSRKPGSRHSSGNSRKSSTNNVHGSRSISGVPVDAYSAALLLCKGNSCTSRNCNSRFSSNSGTVSGTITARKCVGCAAGCDSIPVVCNAVQRRRSGSDAKDDAPLRSAALSPWTFTGTVPYASAATLSSAGGLALSVPSRMQQQLQQNREGQRHRHQQEEQGQSQQQQQSQHIPEQELQQLQQLQQQQHRDESQQQLPSREPTQRVQAHTDNKQGQQNMASIPQMRFSVAPHVDVIHGPIQQTTPLPVSHPLQYWVEHHTQGHEQQQLQSLQKAQALQFPEKQLQCQLLQQVQHPEQQERQQDLHLRGQKVPSNGLKQEAQRVLQPEHHPLSCDESMTTRFEMLNITGGNISMSDASAVYAAATAARRDGLAISFPQPEQNRRGLLPSIHAGENSYLARSNGMPLQQQQQQHQLGVEMSNNTAVQRSIPAVHQSLSPDAGPSPSVAAVATTPHIRLAAASKGHRPSPCTAIPPALPRCSVSTPGAYPEMPSIPVLNSEFDATAAATGEARLSPAAAAILRGAASAAAAAAAAATDAASLVIDRPGESSGTRLVNNTAVTGAARVTPITTAATLVSTASHTYLAESPEMLRRGLQTESSMAIPKSISQAIAETMQARQQQTPPQQQHLHFNRGDHHHHHNVGGSTVTHTARAEDPSRPISVRRSVSVHCTGNQTFASVEDSNFFNNTGHAKALHKLPATALRQSSCFQNTAVNEGGTVDGVDVTAATFSQKAASMEIVTDPLPAASLSAFKNRTPGSSTPDKALVAFQALSYRAAPALCASNTSQEGSAAAPPRSAKSVSAPGTLGEVLCSTTLAGTRAVRVPQTPVADSRATAIDTPSDAAATVDATREKEQVQPAETGSETAARSARRFVEFSREIAAKGGGRASLPTGVDRQPRSPGVRGSLLRPLQLPESPCNNNGIGGGGSTPVGTAGGDTAATKCVSPSSTPGTPQHCHQLQQLLMHRTPAPQDRPRRPAATTAAGVVVRRGGPISMWGFGAVTDPTFGLAAAGNVPRVAAEPAAVTYLEASADATASVSTGSAAATKPAAAGKEAVAVESPSVPEEAQAEEEQQLGSRNTPRNILSPEEKLHIEEGQQSGDAEELEETNIERQPTVTSGTSAPEQQHADKTRHAEDISSATEDTGKVLLAETHQQPEQGNVLQQRDLLHANEKASPPQQQHQLEQCQLKLEEQQNVENSENQRQQLHGTEAQQQELYDRNAALQQGLILELGQQDGCQPIREKQQCAQQASEKKSTEQHEQSLQLQNNETSGEEACSATLSAAPVPRNVEGTTCFPPSVGDRAAAAAADAASSSSAWSFSAAHEEQQLDMQVVNADTCPPGELIYFNSSTKVHGGSSSTSRRNKKGDVKQHSSTSSSDGSKVPRNQRSNDSSGLRSRSRTGSRSTRGRTESNRGDDRCNSNCPELTYFPFSQEHGLSVSPLNGGENQGAAQAGGIAAVSSCNSATWQIHAASGAGTALLFENHQGDSDDSAAALEWECLKYKESPLQQPCAGEHESDVEDNLPVSAAAMAAALAAIPSTRLSGCAVAARGRHERTPERHFTSQQDSPSSSRLVEGDSLQYSVAAPAGEHADSPWATASSWGPTYNLNPNQDDETNKNKAIPQQIGGTFSSSMLSQTTEREPLLHLQGRLCQLQQPDLWENQQLSDQLLELRSCRNTWAGHAAGTENAVDYRHEDSYGSNPAVKRVNATDSAAPGEAAAAVPRGCDSHTAWSCSPSYCGATTQGGEQQLRRRLETPTSAGPDASFFSREFVPPELYQQQGRQQQVLSVPQQQVLKGEAPMSQPTTLSSAAALLREEYPRFSVPPSPPTAWTEPALQQALQQQNLHSLRGPGKLSSFYLRQAAGDTTAAAFDVSVATGKPTYRYTARGEAILVTPPHECTRQFQQSLQHQQQAQSLQQQLLLRQSQQQQQQVASMRQPLNPLFRNRPHSSQLLQTQPFADASSGVMSNSWNCAAVLVTPSPPQQEPLNYNKFPSSAVTHSDRRSSSDNPHSHSPRLKRVAPGAAAAALIAAAGGVTTVIGTTASGAAASTAAGSGAAASTAGGSGAAAGGADVLPRVQQENNEVFCPFRRTVESRRAPAHSNTLGNSSGDIVTAPAGAAEERWQSISSNKSSCGISRNRFLGGTKRLFGGVKVHAAATYRSNKVLGNCESAAPMPGALLAPQQASHSSFNSRWSSHTPTHTPRGDPLLERRFPVSVMHQQPLAGLQQLQSTVASTQPQLIDVRLQPPLSTLSQQQPVSPLSQQQPVSPVSQQQNQWRHSPRTAYQRPQHLLPDSTLAYATLVAQNHPHHRMPEQEGQQFLSHDPNVSMLLREQMPSLYSLRRAKSGLPRRGKSCSSTFLCETIPGSRNGLAIASLRRGSQPGYRRSRNSSLPQLPCAAGRLLLAGGRAVGEVGQAAVDVGSTVVRELANMLHQSFKNILDMEEDSPYTVKREYYNEEHRCIRSNSLCIPVSDGRSRRDSHYLQRQKLLPHSSDSVLGAGQPRQVAGCSTEEQLQHNLWMQRELSRELLQQQQQRGRHGEIQQQREGSWRLQHPTCIQRSDWELSHSCPQHFEEQQQCEGIEQRGSTEGPLPRAWGIATEERLGGLWLPKLDCEYRPLSQTERLSGAEAKAAQQQVSLHHSEQEALDQQQLKWLREDQQQDGDGRQILRHRQRQQQEQGVITRHVKYAEFSDIRRRYPDSEQSMEEDISRAASSADWQMDSHHHTLQHQGGRLQPAHLQQLEESSRDQTSLEQRTIQKGVPAFPISLQWGENTPGTSLPHSLLYSNQQRMTTLASDTGKYLEQQEARDRLVRLAASASTLQPSNISSNRLIGSKSLPARQPFARGPSCWTGCEPDKQQRHVEQDAGSLSTTNANAMAFQQEHDNCTRSGSRHSARQPLSPSLCETGLSGSNKDQLFRTGEGDSSTALREPRKGTSTFGRPELMRQYDGEQSAVCLSDNGSNCSTRNSYKEDERALRDVSVDTLSPRVNPLQETSQREALNGARIIHESRGDGVPLQQQDEVHVRRSQQQQDHHQHDTAVHRKQLDTLSHVHVRTQQESCLSLHVQGIASTKQPFALHPQPFSLPPCRLLQRKQESCLSMPYGGGMQESTHSHAKLEACDRIVQRWKERATRNLAESLAAGTRRGK